MKYFASFNPPIVIEYNGKKHRMDSSKHYDSLASLLKAMESFADEIHNTRMSILAEKDNKTYTPWL